MVNKSKPKEKMVYDKLTGQFNSQLTFKPVFPPLPRAGGLRLLSFPPYGVFLHCNTQSTQVVTPGFEVGRISVCNPRPEPSNLISSPSSPLLRSQEATTPPSCQTLPKSCPLNLLQTFVPKAMGWCIPCDVSPHPFDRPDFCFRRISVCHPSNFGASRRKEK